MYELLFSSASFTVLQIVKLAVKNPEKKEKFRASLLLIRDQINLLFEETV